MPSKKKRLRMIQSYNKEYSNKIIQRKICFKVSKINRTKTN